MKLGDIRIYNRDFELLAVIPQFIASNWELKFCGYGCGEIELEKTDELMSILCENEYLFLVQNDIQSIVTGYKIGKSCMLFTRTLEWLLTKFVVEQVTVGKNLSKTVENMLSGLPEAFGLKFYGTDDECDMSEYKLSGAKDICSALVECIGEREMGFSFRVNLSDGTFTFSLLDKRENEDIFLCDEYRTCYDSEYAHHIQDKVSGAFYYHDVTYMGTWDPYENSPYISITPENFGKYYVVSLNGYGFGFWLSKGDILLCKTPDGTFTKVEEAKPFLVEIPPKEEGIFSWCEIIDTTDKEEAEKILNSKKKLDMLTTKTKLSYRNDYSLGDVIRTKIYGHDTSFSVKKLVSEVHLWTEREDSGESPILKDLKEEDENGV